MMNDMREPFDGTKYRTEVNSTRANFVAAGKERKREKTLGLDEDSETGTRLLVHLFWLSVIFVHGIILSFIR